MDLAKHIFDMGTRMNRTRAEEIRDSGFSGFRPEHGESLTTVHGVFLGDRLLGLYRTEEKAVVTAHRIRVSDVYAGLTWQRVVPYTGDRQVWTCEVHGETVTLAIERRSVE